MGYKIMQKSFFFLSPVEVVKITSQNLEEAAEWCGGSVQETESRRVPGRMDKYVLVPTPQGSNISWAFPGMFVTKRLVVTVKDELRTTFAVFRRDYFEKNYFDTPKDATDRTWEREAAEKARPKKPEVKVMNNVGAKLLEAQRLMKEAGVPDSKIASVIVTEEQPAEVEVPEREGDQPLDPDTVFEPDQVLDAAQLCYWNERHLYEKDDRLPEGCGWRTLHNRQHTELAADASL